MAKAGGARPKSYREVLASYREYLVRERAGLINMWQKRNTPGGEFKEARKLGGAFKGVKKEN